jgi:hypothetical protein
MRVDKDGVIISEVKTGNTAVIKIPPLTQDAQRFTVTSLDDKKQVTNNVILIRDMRRKLNSKEEEWLEEPLMHVKAIKDAFSLIKKPLETAEGIYRKKDKEWDDEQDRIRREQGKKAEEQRRLNEDAIKLAQATDIKVEVNPVPEVKSEIKTVRAELGTSSKTTNWKWRWKEGLSQEEKLARLPLKYHIANNTLIRQLVRASNKNGITEADFNGVIEIYPESGRKYR